MIVSLSAAAIICLIIYYCGTSDHNNVLRLRGTVGPVSTVSTRSRELFFLSTTNDDRHNPHVNPRNTTNPPGLPLFTSRPTRKPTRRPTRRPTNNPISKPSSKPYAKPTLRPSSIPTLKPSMKPKVKPTTKPSTMPSSKPTWKPLPKPSNKPTTKTTTTPSARPTSTPRSIPTTKPSKEPTASPISTPSAKPSYRPTAKPTRKPSAQPSSKPTARPTAKPSSKPTSKPSNRPTAKPSLRPTAKSTERHTKRPTARQTSFPTSRPSSRPSHSLCSSSSGDFGVTNGKDSTMLVSYTYELLLKSNNTAGFDPRISASATVADTVASLEVAISNQLIASLFTSCSTLSSSNSAKGRNLQSNTSNVMGLSSSPADIVTYDTCSISTQLDDTSSCHVVLGRLTLFTQDPSLSYSLYSKSLEVIKMSMESGDLNISPDILRVIYIDNWDDKQILLAVSSLKSSSNVAPIISGVAGFLALLLLLLFLKMRRHRKSKTYNFKDNSTHSDNLFYGRDSERLGIDPVEPYHQGGAAAGAVENIPSSFETTTYEVTIKLLEVAYDYDDDFEGRPASDGSASVSDVEVQMNTNERISPFSYTDNDDDFGFNITHDDSKKPENLINELDSERLGIDPVESYHRSISTEECVSPIIVFTETEGKIGEIEGVIGVNESSCMTTTSINHSDSRNTENVLNGCNSECLGIDPVECYHRGESQHDESFDSSEAIDNMALATYHSIEMPKDELVERESVSLEKVNDSEETSTDGYNPKLNIEQHKLTTVEYVIHDEIYLDQNICMTPRKDIMEGSPNRKSLESIDYQLRLKSDVPLCALCYNEALVATTCCNCGDPECDKIAHTACLLGVKSPLPSISYPGTPPSPLFLCTRVRPSSQQARGGYMESTKSPFTMQFSSSVDEKSLQRLAELDSLIERGDWHGLLKIVQNNNVNDQLNFLSDDGRRRIADIEALVQREDWDGLVEIVKRID